MENYEKLGAFYLGRSYDPEAGQTTDETFLYDSKDLRTHAVCVGMTGSGKTGLCVTLLEEAAIDGIPALVIDPKGDLTNLLLTFPSLDAASFRPWINEDSALQKGISADAYAAEQADLWRTGLAKWGQDGSRIQRLKDSAEFTIYTPGSSAGAQVSVLSSLHAPPAEIVAEPDILAERSGAIVSSLLALLGIDADPIKSREHIFLTSLLQHEWTEGHDLDIAAVIQRIQSPPFTRVGVLELESFYPAKERFELAMQLNNLLASPRFQAWMEGEPLDVGGLLYTDTGKPRVAVFSIAHLDDAERMFFVSLLLNQTLSWMRTRSGTSSLRALLYMDEIFGYLPPVSNPPSKRPLLTMLKQARAFGVGLVLSTQNPVDLDYKALSNAGTWFIGRLQTERDRDRLLDGLSSAAGSVDVGAMSDTIGSLDKRVFVAHNINEEKPALFHTRWAMSYLAGPLTRAQIRNLVGPRAKPVEPASESHERPEARRDGSRETPAVPAGRGTARSSTPLSASGPVLAPEIPQSFLDTRQVMGEATIHYQPAVLGIAEVHLVRRGAAKPHVVSVTYVAPVDSDVPEPDWTSARTTKDLASRLRSQPVPGASYDALPGSAADARSYKRWEKEFADALYRGERVELFTSRRFKLTSEPGESERDFRIRLGDAAREMRDEQVSKLRKKYESKFSRLDERIRKAEQAVGREQDDVRSAKMQTAVSLGATLLSAFLGRKATSLSSVGRATTTLRGAGRTSRSKRDVERAVETLEALRKQREELAQQFDEDVEELEDRFDPQREELESSVMKPRRTDINVKTFTLLWVPPGGLDH
jgi:hypothetical protein